MFQTIYIVCVQQFFVSRGFHYQSADSCPVLGAFRSLNHAREVCDRCVARFHEQGFTSRVVKTDQTTGLVESHVVLKKNNMPERVYNIIKENCI